MMKVKMRQSLLSPLFVTIKRINKDLPLPAYQTGGSVAFDLYSREDVVVPAKEWKLLPSNLIIKTPPGYALILAARSSLFRKTGLMLANGIGVIDQDFCGPEDEVGILVYNTTDHEVEVKKGDRIAQGMFVRVDTCQWEEVEVVDAPTRGGFGSTDLKNN